MFEPIKKQEETTFEFDSSKIISALVKEGKVNDTEIDRATCLKYLGFVCIETGRFFEAESTFKDALRIYRSIPDTGIDQAKCTTGIRHPSDRRLTSTN